MTFSLCTTAVEKQVAQYPDAVCPFGTSTTITTETSNSSTTAVIQHAVVATYQLEEATQSNGSSKRIGSLIPLTITSTRTESLPTRLSLALHKPIPTPAVLDVCSTRTAIFAACGAEQSVLNFGFDDNFAQIKQNTTSNYHPVQTEQDTLTLSVCTSSCGNILCRSTSTGDVIVSTPWGSHYTRHVHDLEAWSACLYTGATRPLDTRSAWEEALPRMRVFSGGDDGMLVGWGLREDGEQFRLRKPHDGVGVTCVTRRPGKEHELWSGGYDDMLKMWDLRHMRNAVEEVNVGGGVWRIQWHPRRKDVALVAAMYDGAKVVKVGEEGMIDVVAEYKKHESIVYGAMWLGKLEERETNKLIAVTSSFYDQAVKLWTVDVGCG